MVFVQYLAGDPVVKVPHPPVRVARVAVAVQFHKRHAQVTLPHAKKGDPHAQVKTIEGMNNPDGSLSVVQQAFQDHHGLQCGFCTPGMVMSSAALLAENPKPTEAEVRHYLEGNICRCTGYHNIVKAVLAASGQDVSSVAAE